LIGGWASLGWGGGDRVEFNAPADNGVQTIEGEPTGKVYSCLINPQSGLEPGTRNGKETEKENG